MSNILLMVRMPRTYGTHGEDICPMPHSSEGYVGI
jgi:hypothetical protein